LGSNSNSMVYILYLQGIIVNIESNFGYNSPRLAASKSTEQKVLIPRSLLRRDSLPVPQSDTSERFLLK
jgi:hypothetical protein